MRKLIISAAMLLMAVFLSFSAVACSSKEPENDIIPNDKTEVEVASKDSIKILAVGNSFSDNAMKFLYPILDAFGVEEIVLGNLYIGGCTVETHFNNALNDSPAYIYRKNTEGTFVNTMNTRMITALKEESWQFVTMQQASGSSGIIDTYNQQIKALSGYVKDNVSNDKLKMAWHMTWAYQQNATHAEFIKYQNSQAVMYANIVDCVKSKIINNKDFNYVIPAGTAIQNARTSYLGDTLTIDGYHLNELGEFIIGLTWVVTLTNWDLDDINTDKIPRQFAQHYDVIAESVKNAVKTPYEVTQSKYVNT